MSAVTYEKSGSVGRVTLNRPDRLNAINFDLIDGLLRALDQAAVDTDVSAIVLQGAGRAFSSGDDLIELSSAAFNLETLESTVAKLQDITRRLVYGAKPIICAVQGFVVGGAIAWPLAADFAIFSDDATLFSPETRHGLFASGGATILLSDRCGPEQAQRILYFGERYAADDLVRLRIASEVVSRAELAGRAMALAQSICALPRTSVRRLKRVRAQILRSRLEEALKIEALYCAEAARDAETRLRAGATLKAPS